MSTPPDVIVRWVGASVVVETKCERVESVVASLVCAIHKVDEPLGTVIAELMKVRAALYEKVAERITKPQEPSN